MKDADKVRGMIQEVGSRGKVLHIETSAVQRLVFLILTGGVKTYCR